MALFLFLLLVLAPQESASEPVEAAPPVAVFAELDGTWSGEFVGYDARGRELYRIRVRQTYRTVDEHTQEVQIADEMPDGTTIRGKGTNVARRRPDGSLELTCRVEKSNGDVVEHAGRLVRGAEGDEQLVWYSETKGRTETFRERVRHEGERDVYSIDGMGIYDGTPILMSGVYVRAAR